MCQDLTLYVSYVVYYHLWTYVFPKSVLQFCLFCGTLCWGGQWTDETALCGQRTTQVSVPSSLGQALWCMQEANGPASIWESPVSSPISLWEHWYHRCVLPYPDLMRFQRFKLRSLHLHLYFLSELPSHSFVMWFIWSNYLCKTLSKIQSFWA